MPATIDGPDPAVFMEHVMAAIGVRTPNALIDQLSAEHVVHGLPSQLASEIRKAWKWRAGEHAPSFAWTMVLLRRAGFLTAEGLACFPQK